MQLSLTLRAGLILLELNVLQLSTEKMDARVETEAGFALWFAEQFMPVHLVEFHAAFPREKRIAAAVRARRTALHFGFSDPGSQAHFAALMWRVAANFFLFPGFREIVAQRSVDGPTRIDRFYKLVTPEQAADAVLQGDDTLLFSGPFDDEDSA